MPLFKGSASKSTPYKAIRYITDPKKAVHISVRNLFEDEDYAKQFKETANRFGKGNKHDERKYYHFKLSCAQNDNVDPQEAHAFAEELTARLFKDCECVIATHNDTKTIHSHIVVNAIHPITGKKLRFANIQYATMKDEANFLGKEFGFTPTNFRKKSENKRTQEESHIILKGGNSWKEDLREVIEEAKQTATTKEEFIAHLQLYNVKVTRSISEYSFLHPQKQKPIRGKKLGENYSKEIIENVITKNRHRIYSADPSRKGGNGTSTSRVQGVGEATRIKTTPDSSSRIARTEHTQFSSDGQHITQRSISDREREMQRLNRAAEYAHRGTDFSGKRDSETNISNRNTIRNDGRQSGQRNSSGIDKSKSSEVGNKSSNKNRDYDFSK